MALTQAQLQTLHAAILADGTLNAFPNTGDGNIALAQVLNQVASPQVLLWRPDISRDALTSGIVMSEYIANPVGDARRQGWFALTQAETIDATQAAVRQQFTDLFSGPAPNTLTNLLNIARRPATRIEALFATVAGSASISELYGYRANGQDVGEARMLP